MFSKCNTQHYIRRNKIRKNVNFKSVKLKFYIQKILLKSVYKVSKFRNFVKISTIEFDLFSDLILEITEFGSFRTTLLATLYNLVQFQSGKIQWFNTNKERWFFKRFFSDSPVMPKVPSTSAGNPPKASVS